MRSRLLELALLFTRLGLTAFGGPAAHIAMMREEVVVRRAWLTEARFLDLLGATSVIPGPSSTELAIHVGWDRARLAGLVVAGVCFIAPAMLVTGVCAALYVRYGGVPAMQWVLYGVKPAVLGVVVQAIVSLAPKAAKTRTLRALGAIAVVLSLLGVHELAILFGAGGLAIVVERARRGDVAGERRDGAPWLPLATFGGATATTSVSHASLFGVFLKVGTFLFGSGYVLLAFLRAELVERLGWMTEAQLIDAVAVGQVTPGPVFTTATFVGYLLAGPTGALVATAGIFLPAFVFVGLSIPLLPRMRASRSTSAFMDGVNVASIALMIVVSLQLGRSAFVDVPTVIIGLVAAYVLVRHTPNPTWLVLGGGVAGVALHASGLAR